MASITQVLCDQCNRQLNIQSDCPHEYGVSLSPQDFKESKGGSVYAVYQRPPLDRDYHFCGVVCLQKWVNNEVDNKGS